MRSALRWGVAAAALACMATAASAAPLTGTLTLGSNGVQPDTGPFPDPGGATSFNTPDSAFYSSGTGGFAALTGGGSAATPLLTFNPSPVSVPAGLGGPVASSEVLTGSGAASGFGTFTASSVQTVSRTAGVLGVVFTGTYTPNFGGFDPSEPAILVVSLTRAPPGAPAGQASVSFSATLSVSGTPTPPSVPEPASMALLGSGLLGLGLARRRRRKAD